VNGKVKRYGTTVLIAATLIACLIITGSFYLVKSGTAVAEVVALLGAFGTMATAIITLMVKTDQQSEKIEQIEKNTNGILKQHVREAVTEAVVSEVVPAVQSANEGNSQR